MAAITMAEMWTTVGSTIASFMFVWTIIRQYCPYEVRHFLEKSMHRCMSFFNPYIHVSIHEFMGTGLNRSEAYAAVEAYLSTNSAKNAKRLKLEMEKDSKKIVLTMDEYEKVTDEFQGAEISWVLGIRSPKPVGNGNNSQRERRYYNLTFHKRYREMIAESYLEHVMKKGKEIRVKNRQRKLYTNGARDEYAYPRQPMWSDVPFEHPARFESVAMEAEKKQEIIEDLLTFSQSKDFYARIGKAWKRGYLLYGPPGTGKSTMIAAMANLLNYDVYDLELTAVKDNTELKKLLIEITGKSIIVIEDIDCSLDLIGDDHIELSYCSFEGFKVLAKNYLLVEAHPLFDMIRQLMGETKITPADVAEALMRKSPREDVAKSLSKLIQALEEAKKEAATKKAEEQSRVMAPAKDFSLLQDKKETEEPQSLDDGAVLL
ncbi:hypothetical protein RHSIM_Rhsim08G0162400 [Rhododendron simsii]|uniref:AAA+ ATPase domain-containing protein n=1 Tax=Rhododendron simsii TaxID=118357 RepID=A0A834GP12_RHOSS|nr:hypothetical protein RHSIM_Rhsim08G0162400 [Rhododendron simsii]